MSDLSLALPARGRIQEQTTEFLAGAGLRAVATGGVRSYRGRLEGIAGIELRYLRASEIPFGLKRGESHLGVTGDDLIAEAGGYDGDVQRIRSFDFGHARLAVAVPAGWVDVSTMADLEEVAAHLPGRLRVATKYERLAAEFLTRHGIGSFRVIASQGATEGTVAAGVADVIVDIYSSGRTLAANRLRPLDDGEILSSSASLIASRRADWTERHIAAGEEFLARMDARILALGSAVLHYDPQVTPESGVMDRYRLSVLGPGEIRCPTEHASSAARALVSLGARSVRVSRSDQIFLGARTGLEALMRG